MFAFLLLFCGLLFVSTNGHTTKICTHVDGADVTFYAGSYHYESEVVSLSGASGKPIGGVLLSNGPSGNGRYDFTSYINSESSGSEFPPGVDLSTVTCTECSYNAHRNIWQVVTISGLQDGTYDVTTTTDTQVEYPYCTFPSITIEDVCGHFSCESESLCNKCQETFGNECLSCENEFGCTECDYGYELTFDRECMEYFCQVESCGPAPVVCDIRDQVDDGHHILQCSTSPCNCNGDCQFCQVCHENGCDQCDNGYFKQSYNHPCVHCQEYFGNSCMFCQDFDGCGQCIDGYTKTYNSDTKLWECV